MKTGLQPICPICEQPIQNGICDMHEVIFTRGDIAGLSDDLKRLFYVRYNVVVVHHGACHEAAATKDGRRKCIKQLCDLYGKEAILDWVRSVSEHLPESLVKEVELP